MVYPSGQAIQRSKINEGDFCQIIQAWEGFTLYASNCDINDSFGPKLEAIETLKPAKKRREEEH